MSSQTQILQTIAFLDLLAAGLIVPQLPNHARILGCNPLLIGVMGALYAGFQLIADPVIGTLSDIKGRKTVLVLTVTLCGIGYVLLGVTTSIVLFLGLRAFLGFFKHSQRLTKSLAPQYEEGKDKLLELNRNIDKISAIGMSIAPFIGGTIMETFPKHGFSIIAYIVGAIFVINSGLVGQLPKEKRKEKDIVKDHVILLPLTLVDSVVTSFKQSRELFHKIDWDLYRNVLLIRGLSTLVMGVYFCNYAVYLRGKHEASAQTLGFITSLIWSISSFVTYFIGYVNKIYEYDKDFTERNYHAFLIMTLSLTCMALAPSITVYVICIIPLAISFVLSRSYTLEVILSRTESEHTNTVQGVANSIRNVCGVAAPLLAGLTGYYVGIFYIIYVCLIFSAIGAYKSYCVVFDITPMDMKRVSDEHED